MFNIKKNEVAKEKKKQYYIEFIFNKLNGLTSYYDDHDSAKAELKSLYEKILNDEDWLSKDGEILITPEHFSHAYVSWKIAEEKEE